MTASDLVGLPGPETGHARGGTRRRVRERSQEPEVVCHPDREQRLDPPGRPRVCVVEVGAAGVERAHVLV